MTKSQQQTLLSVFPSFCIGGAQARFAALANHFGADFRHVIVAMDGVYDCVDRLSPNLDIVLHAVLNRKGDTLGSRRRFREVLHSIRPDHLFTHNWGSIEWAMANWPTVVPHVHVEDGFGPEEANRQIPRRAWTRRLTLRNTRVVVPSRQLERIALDQWRLRRHTVHYIPNGIDTERFAASDLSPLLARDDRPVIGTVAALRPEKNLVRLIDAFRIVRADRPCRLVIAGDGTERTKLEAHVAALGLAADVQFIGYQTDTARVYAAIDLFALSSDTEQLPTAVLEAMAASLPVVSTDVGDVRDMVSGGNAPFIVQRNAEAMARAMITLLGDEALRQKIGKANNALAVQNFSQDGMFSAYRELFARKA